MPLTGPSAEDTDIAMIASLLKRVARLEQRSAGGFSGNTFFGDGSDGDATISGGTTVLAGDMAYGNLQIDADGVLDTGSYLVTVSGTLSGTGRIICNGNDAVDFTAGARKNAGYFRGAAGGNGGDFAGLAGQGGDMAAGGDGGDGDSGTGGLGGSVFSGQTFPVKAGLPGDIVTYIAEYDNAATGGGGGAGNGSDIGGGGGGSATAVWVAARIITFTGSIECKGGNGADGSADGTGGGGGGGGGYMVILAASGVHLPTYDVSGGLPGASGGGAGTDGEPGSDGHLSLYTVPTN